MIVRAVPASERSPPLLVDRDLQAGWGLGPPFADSEQLTSETPSSTPPRRAPPIEAPWEEGSEEACSRAAS